MIRFNRRVILLVLLIAACRAQINIHLPASVSVTVNENPYLFSEKWMDSLRTEAALGKICFVISRCSSSPRSVRTVIQVPQILPLSAVYRQFILYYASLGDEHSRKKELLKIYPYFHKLDKTPFLTVTYESEGRFLVELDRWKRIDVPPPPTLIEREIYNQILQTSFSGVVIFGSLSEDIFRQIAQQNGLSVERVSSIYQNTMLWQQFRQFSARNE